MPGPGRSTVVVSRGSPLRPNERNPHAIPAAGTGERAIYVLAIMIGNGLYEAGKTGAEDGPGVLADLQRTTSPVQTVGLALEILGFTAFLVFLGALYRTLRRRGADRTAGSPPPPSAPDS